MAHQTGVSADADDAGRVSLMNDPKARGLVFQALLIIAVIFLVYSGISNAIDNLARAGIASGLGFFGERAGFDIGQSFIPYTNDSTYLRAFFVGLLNTMVVAIIGIFLATVIGFIVGLARLSKNYLVQKFATVYVETLRNIPLLLQLLFWYKAVLSILPSPRAGGLEPGVEVVFNLNNRGLYMPRIIPEGGAELVGYALVLAIVAWIVIGRWAKKRQMATGQQFPVFFTGLGLVIVLPLLTFLVARICQPSGFQHGWRLGDPARVHGASSGAVALHGFVHRRNRPRRYPGGVAWSVGSSVRTGSATKPDQPSCGGAAGDAGHHSATDQPVPEPDQELFAGGCNRLP